MTKEAPSPAPPRKAPSTRTILVAVSGASLLLLVSLDLTVQVSWSRSSSRDMMKSSVRSWPSAELFNNCTTTTVPKAPSSFPTVASIPFGSLGPLGTDRQRLRYYDTLMALTIEFGNQARSFLEVGCTSDPFSRHLSWVPDRICVSPYYAGYNKVRGTAGTQQADNRTTSTSVRMVVADFYKWEPDRRYDVALCSQVVEHVKDPAAFVQKLVASADTTIISVPYKWSKASTSKQAHHVSHDIEEATIARWAFPHRPVVTARVRDGDRERLIAVFTTGAPSKAGKPVEPTPPETPSRAAA